MIGQARTWTNVAATLAAATLHAQTLTIGFPDEHGLDARPLLRLAEWVRDESPPIFSLLVSRHGALVFELYTSSLTRDHAHYVMSVTKTVTSALMGIAIGKRLVGPPETHVADALPARLFSSEAERARFRAVTIHDVLGMSALDAPMFPHRDLPEDRERMRLFWETPNRTTFALTQPLLPSPGKSFLYTDVTPLLAIGILQHAAKCSALEFAEKTLFGPMQFANYEWMHQDRDGYDNGSYGLRLRPIDMQKLGLLYLRDGKWDKQQLVPRDWVARSFEPWIKSRTDAAEPDYGWYWWTQSYGRGWKVHSANGWRGQRILVFPEQDVVITMTGIVEGRDEAAIESRIVRDHVIPAVLGTKDARHRTDRALRKPLEALLEKVREGPLRAPKDVEARMVPSVDPKERHRAFDAK